MSKLKDNDDFGNRIKGYEAVETARKLNVHLPVYARIDGRAFSTFTRDMNHPFDERMYVAMDATTEFLVKSTHAKCGYHQSDEISLVWLAETELSDIFFSGKVQKMCSVLAGMASAKFNRLIGEFFSSRSPHFDCRVFQLPSKEEAANTFLWRAMDARKNAIQSVAQRHFSHKELFGKSQADMLTMLLGIGESMYDYLPHYRYGTFIRPKNVERHLTKDELEAIPEKNRPTGPVVRTEYKHLSIPAFNKVTNRVGFIFDGEDPITEE